MDPEEASQSFPLQEAPPMAEEQSFADSSEEGRSRQTGQHWGQIISSLVIAVLMLFIGLGIGYVIWGANAVTATVLPEVQPLGGGKTRRREFALTDSEQRSVRANRRIDRLRPRPRCLSRCRRATRCRSVTVHWGRNWSAPAPSTCRPLFSCSLRAATPCHRNSRQSCAMAVIHL